MIAVPLKFPPFLKKLIQSPESEGEVTLSEKTKVYLLPSESVGGSRESKNSSKDLVTGR